MTITTKNGVYLGKTLFTYVDQNEEMSEMLKQIVKSRKLKGELFKMLGRQCETDESEENNTRTFGKFKCLSFIWSREVRIWLSLKPHQVAEYVLFSEQYPVKKSTTLLSTSMQINI